MKMVKRLFMILVIVLLQNTLSAQTNVNTSTTVINQNVTEGVQAKQTLTDNTLISPASDSEPTPTPEQQGFTKTLIDGKTVYYKKVDGVLIEYKPE